MSSPLAARVIVELIGTFLLALTIQLMVLNAPDLALIAPLAIALILTALVYAGGPISAAMYNPAVLAGFVMCKGFPRSEIGPYLGAQLIGAALAAACGLLLRGQAAIAIEPEPTIAIISEAIFTFALLWVIFQVTSERQRGNGWYGLAIGFVVGGGAYAVGTVSGAVFNPAVWASLAATGKLAWSTWWIYLIGQGLGLLLAVVAQRIIESEQP